MKTTQSAASHRCLLHIGKALGAVALAATFVSAGMARDRTQWRALPDSALHILASSRFQGRANARDVLHLAVSLQPKDMEGLEEYGNLVSDPASPLYGAYLTPEDVGERFGASPAQISTAANYLTSNGMKVTLIAPNRMAILADATVAQAEAAFNTRIHNFTGPNPVGPGRITFHANSTAAMAPSFLASTIINVEGLEDYTRPLPRATTTLLNPTQTRGAYNTAPMYGSSFLGQGRTIAISNWDGFSLSNASKYITTYGLPVPSSGALSNITVVTIDGGSAKKRAQGEGDLDIQMELGMAPLANIRIYDGSGGDLINVLTREASDNLADVISESYGWNLSSTAAAAAHTQHLAMTTQGMTYVAASGDSGTTLEPYSYPNYEPEVLNVGGTVATVDTITGALFSEVGWSGSGGGWSTNSAAFNVEPAYQLNYGLPNIGKRLCPDVALHSAGNRTGAYYFYLKNKLTGAYVGTSFASPVFAGCLGICGQKLNKRFGRIQDTLYAQHDASYWHDITSGSNGKLPDGTTSKAGPGWDYVTGLGSMDFNAFVTANGK